MIKLEPYSPAYKKRTIDRISQFFGFHKSLISNNFSTNDLSYTQNAEELETLSEWLENPSALFIILDDDTDIGFIRICFRGSNVAWIEDIFVDAEYRKQGVASDAIREAERIIENTPGYTAVCLDVSPRNLDALRLYHKLGYIDINLISIRKDFNESKRNLPMKILGLDFNY